MIFKINWLMTIVILVVLSSSTSSSLYSVAAQTNSTWATFNDSETGISFQYPSDWHTASQEYLNMMFRSDSGTDSNSSSIQDMESNVNPIAMILPESLSGSAFFILSELLPFNLPIDRYFELTKENIMIDPTANVSDPIPVAVGDLNGLKYNITSNTGSGTVQTQMMFVNDSKGYIVASQVGNADQVKESQDLDSIIATLKFNGSAAK